jgi:hypothetical protein
MSTVPAACAGEVRVQVVVVQLAAVAGFWPKLAVVAPAMKPVPETVTIVPAVSGPAFGLIELTLGAVL